MVNKPWSLNINKHSMFFLLLALFLFYSTDLLQAQEKRKYLEINANPAQRLIWPDDKNALRYEVIIEEEEAGRYRLLQREFTYVERFEISLPPGRYRYRIIPYDLQDQPGQGSEWEVLDIDPSLREEILTVFLPNSFNLNEDIEWTFYVWGETLDDISDVYLYHSATSLFFLPILTDRLGNNEAWLGFAYDQLIPGVYEVYIVNPGDKEASKGYFLLNYPSRPPPPPPEEPEPPPEEPDPSDILDIYLGAAWTPLIDLPGFNYLFSGTMLHFSLIGRGQSFLDFGLELETSWYDFFKPQKEAVQSLLTGSNFLIQKQFLNQKLELTFRIGMGVVIPIKGDAYPLDKTVIYGNAGTSVRWLVLKHFFVEGGLNFTVLIKDDNFNSLFRISLFRPLASLGIKF